MTRNEKQTCRDSGRAPERHGSRRETDRVGVGSDLVYMDADFYGKIVHHDRIFEEVRMPATITACTDLRSPCPFVAKAEVCRGEEDFGSAVDWWP